LKACGLEYLFAELKVFWPRRALSGMPLLPLSGARSCIWGSIHIKSNSRNLPAREGWKAVVENYRLATGYPDPELNLAYYPEPIESRLGPLDWNASLNQKIPFPGKLTQAGKLVESEARVGRLVTGGFQPLVFDLKSLYRLPETNKDEIRIARDSLIEYWRRFAFLPQDNEKITPEACLAMCGFSGR